MWHNQRNWKGKAEKDEAFLSLKFIFRIYRKKDCQQKWMFDCDSATKNT